MTTATQSNLIELARQGNAKAIATLMNRQLQSRGITAKATLKDGCLQVILESAQVPNQEALVEFIRKGVIGLQTASIQRVKLYGWQIAGEIPAWQQEFELAKQPLTVPSATASQSRTTNETQNRQQNLTPSKKITTKSSDNALLNWMNLSAKPFATRLCYNFSHFPNTIKFGVMGTLFLVISIPIVSNYRQADSNFSNSNTSNLDRQYKSQLEEVIKIHLKNDEDIVSTMSVFQEAGGFNASKERAIKNCKKLSEGTLKDQLILPDDEKALKALNLYQFGRPLTDEEMKKSLNFGKIHIAEVYTAQAVYCPNTYKSFKINN